MKYYAIIYDSNSLSHHGIKGMKWGVRKDKKEGLYSRYKKKKERKKREKDLFNKFINSSEKYRKEYNKSKGGSKKYKAYMREIDMVENDPSYGDSPKNSAKFFKIEENYLRGVTRAEASGLLKEYGRSEFIEFMNTDPHFKPISGKEDLVKEYEERHWRDHSYV